MQSTFETLKYIADAIQQTGSDPHDQLFGYISTGDVAYITRRDHARELIQTVEKDAIAQFMKELK